jgi:hypothetical protein
MRVVLDHNLPRRFARLLIGHDVKTTRQMGWEKFRNGVLLRAAAGQFDAFVTVDKNLEREQNLRTLPLPVIQIDTRSNALPFLTPFAPFLLDLLKSPLDPMLYIVQVNGSTLRLTSPRP